jgi:hypothetical protein
VPHLSVFRRLAPLALIALACEGPADPVGVPEFARTPGGPTVTATTPDTAVQDTTLDVQISGSGFDAGSQAEWLLAGVPDPRVRTNSTRYVSDRSLVANITIAKDAIPGSYDVAVTTSRGKKGIGTEMFVVQLRDPTAIVEVTDAGMAVHSDGRGPYVGDECGVGARIYVANGSGDAVLNPYQTSPTTSALCGGVPRVLNIDLGSLGVQAVSATNAAAVAHLLAPNSRLQDFGFGLVNGKVCTRVKYNAEVGGQALVTATGLDVLGRRTWVVESQSPHHAGCYKTSKGKQVWDGVRRVVPFRITITEVPPL